MYTTLLGILCKLWVVSVILGIVDRLVNSKNVHPVLILSTGTVTKPEEIVQEEDFATTEVEPATASRRAAPCRFAGREHFGGPNGVDGRAR